MGGLRAYLFVWLVQLFSAQGDRTACRVRPDSRMEKASITCYFPEDINVSKKNFAVYHYNGKQRPASVLDCLWVSGRLNCSATDGYEYSHTVANTATLRIPHVTRHVTGGYACQISGSKQEDLEFCELHFNTEKTKCEIPSVPPQGTTNLTCYFPENVSDSRKDFAVYLFKDREMSIAVVDCLWIKDTMTCSAQHGYQVTSEVSDRFAVHIPQALQNHTGTYLCGFSGYQPDSSLSCDLYLRYPGASEAAAATVVIIILALTTSFLFLWIVVCKCVKKNQDADTWEPQNNIRGLLNSCLTTKRVRRDRIVIPQQRIAAPSKHSKAHNWAFLRSLLGRAARNQDEAREEEEGTARALLTSNTEEQHVPRKIFQGQTDTNGQGGTSEDDSRELQTTVSICSTQIQANIVDPRLCQDCDTMNTTDEAIDSIKSKSKRTQQQKQRERKDIKGCEKFKDSSDAIGVRSSTNTDKGKALQSSENAIRGDHSQSETQTPAGMGEQEVDEAVKTTTKLEVQAEMTSSDLPSAPPGGRLHMQPSQSAEMSRQTTGTLQETKDKGRSSKKRATKQVATRTTSTGRKEKHDTNFSAEIDTDAIAGPPHGGPDDYDSDEATNAYVGRKKAK